MKRLVTIAFALVGATLAIPTLFLVMRARVPQIRLPDTAWRRGFADVIDEVPDKVEGAVE